MTHFKVDIQLPLTYNPEKGKKIGEKIPEEYYLETHEELLKIVGGISTNQTPIKGSWAGGLLLIGVVAIVLFIILQIIGSRAMALAI